MRYSGGRPWGPLGHCGLGGTACPIGAQVGALCSLMPVERTADHSPISESFAFVPASSGLALPNRAVLRSGGAAARHRGGASRAALSLGGPREGRAAKAHRFPRSTRGSFVRAFSAAWSCPAGYRERIAAPAPRPCVRCRTRLKQARGRCGLQRALAMHYSESWRGRLPGQVREHEAAGA
jgi:hypothetical protein